MRGSRENRDAMKNRFCLRMALALLSCSPVLMVSCLETTKSETDSKAAITKVSLGNFKVKIHDINADRRDTVIYETYGGAMYPMTIDQYSNTIYNLDSLPKGSLLERVPANTISATGFVYFKDKSRDSFVQWQSADSIDFTDTVFFKVMSTDKSFTRDYVMKVNVHTYYPDSMTWKKADDYGWSGMYAVASALKDGKVYVFGRDFDNVTVMANDLKTGARVLESPVTGLSGYRWSGKVAVWGGRFYTVCSGNLCVSDDGIDWTVAVSGMKSLLNPGSGLSRMWAVGSDGMLKWSADMQDWNDFQAVPKNFPDSVASVVEYGLASNPGKSRLVAMGYGADAAKVQVWTCISTDTCWTRIEPGYRSKLMPARKSLNMFMYDGSLFACGDVLDGFYQSQDNGINWRYCDSYVEEYDSWNQYMQVPASMKDEMGAVSCVVDSDNYIWIVNAYGALWKGIINRKVR